MLYSEKFGGHHIIGYNNNIIIISKHAGYEAVVRLIYIPGSAHHRDSPLHNVYEVNVLSEDAGMKSEEVKSC